MGDPGLAGPEQLVVADQMGFFVRVVGHYTDKKTHFYIFFSHFVRVLTHYGSNESNDSFGFFCEPM